MTAPNLPASLVENPRLDRWIRFQPDRTVRIATGKVEIPFGHRHLGRNKACGLLFAGVSVKLDIRFMPFGAIIRNSSSLEIDPGNFVRVRFSKHFPSLIQKFLCGVQVSTFEINVCQFPLDSCGGYRRFAATAPLKWQRVDSLVSVAQ